MLKKLKNIKKKKKLYHYIYQITILRSYVSILNHGYRVTVGLLSEID